MNESMIRAYLMQSTQYYSESGEKMLLIYSMNPRHAANAAEKLLRDAEHWVKEAGVNVRNPRLWVTRTALFGALAAQGG
jgi:hypothetical protein